MNGISGNHVQSNGETTSNNHMSILHNCAAPDTRSSLPASENGVQYQDLVATEPPGAHGTSSRVAPPKPPRPATMRSFSQPSSYYYGSTRPVSPPRSSSVGCTRPVQPNSSPGEEARPVRCQSNPVARPSTHRLPQRSNSHPTRPQCDENTAPFRVSSSVDLIEEMYKLFIPLDSEDESSEPFRTIYPAKSLLKSSSTRFISVKVSVLFFSRDKRCQFEIY